jgi:hypothetical protein
MFSLEQKHLADAQVAKIVARLRAEGKIPHQGLPQLDHEPDPQYPTTTWGWIRWYGPVRWLRVRYRMWMFWRLWHSKG